MNINYNWFGVKRPYPHYHYYLTCVSDDVWVVQDNEPIEEGDWRICHTRLSERKFIDLLTQWENIVPVGVIESTMRYIESRHFQDWISYEDMRDVD